MSVTPKVFVALDFASAERALQLADELSPELCGLKVGKQLFTSTGPELVRELVAKDYKVFLDLKFHDIPNTVAAAVQAAAKLGVWMVNVHASGGSEMLTAAREALEKEANKPLLTAVTVLTSMNQQNIDEIGIDRKLEEQVAALALLAEQNGLDGVVCSAAEAKMLREQVSKDFLLVTPGIRPPGVAAGDQKRIVTPPEALSLGASYLVIGRPITGADEPRKTLLTINESIADKL